MDTSKTYVKMCEKAQEIQSIFNDRELTSDDVLFISYDQGKTYKKEKILDLFPKPFIQEDYNNIVIWLPRQDQLQELMGSYDDCLELIYWWKETGKIIIRGDDKEDYWLYSSSDFNSMEQFLLAAVMFRNYDKIWGGEDWIDNNSQK